MDQASAVHDGPRRTARPERVSRSDYRPVPSRHSVTLGYPEATVSPEVDALLLGSSNLPAQLRRAVDESTRLLSAAGAILYLLDETGTTLRWAYDAGIRDADELAWVRSLSFSVGVGLFGRSVSEGHAMSTRDYRTDSRFVHSPLLDRFVEDMNVRSMAVAPLIGATGSLGAIGVFSHEPDAYDESAEALIATLAQHAALAIDNARLIDQLARSGEALSRRASAERSLREIAARITAIRDQGIIAQQVVDELHRLLESDCALLALVTGSEIHSAVVAGELSPEAREYVTTQRLHVRGSMLEVAVQSRTSVTTTDYLADVVATEDGHNVALAESLGIRGVAVAPLRVEDRVVGLLGVLESPAPTVRCRRDGAAPGHGRRRRDRRRQRPSHARSADLRRAVPLHDRALAGHRGRGRPAAASSRT